LARPRRTTTGSARRLGAGPAGIARVAAERAARGRLGQDGGHTDLDFESLGLELVLERLQLVLLEQLERGLLADPPHALQRADQRNRRPGPDRRRPVPGRHSAEGGGPAAERARDPPSRTTAARRRSPDDLERRDARHEI